MSSSLVATYPFVSTAEINKTLNVVYLGEAQHKDTSTFEYGSKDSTMSEESNTLEQSNTSTEEQVQPKQSTQKRPTHTEFNVQNVALIVAGILSLNKAIHQSAKHKIPSKIKIGLS